MPHRTRTFERQLIVPAAPSIFGNAPFVHQPQHLPNVLMLLNPCLNPWWVMWEGMKRTVWSRRIEECRSPLASTEGRGDPN